MSSQRESKKEWDGGGGREGHRRRHIGREGDGDGEREKEKETEEREGEDELEIGGRDGHAFPSIPLTCAQYTDADAYKHIFAGMVGMGGMTGKEGLNSVLVTSSEFERV